MPRADTGRGAGRGHLLTWVVAAAGVAVLAYGVMTYVEQSPPGRAAATAPETSSESTAAGRASFPEPEPAPRTPGAPRSLSIPALGVSTPVLPVKTVGRTLVPPSDPQKVGWWADGAKPGAVKGSALLAGHSVRNGEGALDLISELEPGDVVRIRDGRGQTITYHVSRVRTYDKGEIAQDAGRLFSQKVRGRLVLVTCADWDGTRYLSNVVVVAQPTRRTA